MRRKNAESGAGHAFIAPSFGPGGLPLTLDLSQIEVTEEAF
ncbi:MAG: hypothetical protein WB789_06275 [Thermoplasmata archaeon]